MEVTPAVPQGQRMTEEEASRIRQLLEKCYDDGLSSENIGREIGTAEIHDDYVVFILEDDIDDLIIEWLKARTVIVIFQVKDQTLSLLYREQLIRIYEDGWYRDPAINPTAKRGRTHGEGPKVMSYVARAPGIAQRLTTLGSVDVPRREGSFKVLFKPWMTRAEPDQMRSQEQAAKFRLIALRVPLISMRLQMMVGELSLRSIEEPEDEGGAISMAVWLKKMVDDILDIIWWLEEGPDPQLEACIVWKRAEAMMSTCYDLFTEGRNLRYKLEDRLKGKDDLEGEDWQEDGAQGDEVDSNISINNNNINDNNNTNNNNNNDYNNNNNDNNNGYSGNNNDDNISINNQNVNNNTYNRSAEHGSSGVENARRRRGAISMAVWLKNMADDMLDIIWWLEEGPDPQLETCIDWKRAEAMMSTCYDLFAEGRNLRYKLEDRLKGKDDLEVEDWQEDGAQGDEVNSSISINNNNINDNNINDNNINDNNINDNNNINNNNDYNNNNNDNNNGYSDNNNDDNLNINNENVNNNTYNGSAEHGSSGVENGARTYLIIVSDMGEMPHVDAVEFGVDNNNGVGGNDDDGGRDHHDNSHNNDNNNNVDNNNNSGDGGSDDYGANDDPSSSRAESISMTGEMLHADVEGSGLDTDKRFANFPPLPPLNLVGWLKLGVG
ncbi:hypothetical protein CBR_g10887 [Chara braunii]|uniref:Uncharacterized protein n=1 Tax=Chara braunii TaxID=69332 RepID=A0A388KPF7_CHABU|nr:hypothetical protein CBR_g10887 [Chara braunii]|eukprot:GBG71950.1 hypothetical protein CBR_g10887 [Chara braunii]